METDVIHPVAAPGYLYDAIIMLSIKFHCIVPYKLALNTPRLPPPAAATATTTSGGTGGNSGGRKAGNGGQSGAVPPASIQPPANTTSATPSFNNPAPTGKRRSTPSMPLYPRGRSNGSGGTRGGSSGKTGNPAHSKPSATPSSPSTTTTTSTSTASAKKRTPTPPTTTTTTTSATPVASASAGSSRGGTRGSAAGAVATPQKSVVQQDGIGRTIPIIDTMALVDEKTRLLENLQYIGVGLALLHDLPSKTHKKSNHDQKMDVDTSKTTSKTKTKNKGKDKENESEDKMQIDLGITNTSPSAKDAKFSLLLNALDCSLAPVPVKSEEWTILEQMMRSCPGVNIVDIIRVERKGERERFNKFKQLGNCMLLSHGTKIENVLGILRQGMLIAPPEAPSSGNLFGKGLYFADMPLKSAAYCTFL
eukprot:TRINITY_DN6823_c0_g1_i3.p1 TRINITY_DN6823_c0_g1~~TRINITY_DN6823_c0_g1_i3.p1  ORF type:complete len:437 (-),score=74.21 TRINITY_DN6823_c0_g1_i3:774-2036(-)